VVDPVPDASRHSGCCAGDSLESKHYLSMPASIFACEIPDFLSS
jgi:hypothetical protein